MAKATTVIHKDVLTETEARDHALHDLGQSVAAHGEALQQTLLLVQELHDSGLLQMMQSLLASKEKVAEIAVSQLNKPSVTRTLNHATEAVGALGEMDPAVTKKMISGFVNGVEKANEALEKQETIGMLDLWKALKDPSINKAMAAMLGFLKGMGDKL